MITGYQCFFFIGEESNYNLARTLLKIVISFIFDAPI